MRFFVVIFQEIVNFPRIFLIFYYKFTKISPISSILVLDTFDDNIDDSLNFLYDKYFPFKNKNPQPPDSDYDENTRFQVMDDEKESLLSIFPNEFVEIEKNSIWQFKVFLNYLLKFSPSEVNKKEQRRQKEIEARAEEMREMMLKKKRSKVEKCKNMVEKGKCRFGHNCRFSHNINGNDDDGDEKQVQTKKTTTDGDDQKIWYLEVRFPKWCKLIRGFLTENFKF